MATEVISTGELSYWRRPLVRPWRMVICRADRTSIALFFACLFAFVGVMGVLISVPGVKTLRGYYALLPIGVSTLIFFSTKTTWKAILTCVPLITYLTCSAALGSRDPITQSYTPMGMLYAVQKTPMIFFAVMLVAQMLFVIIAASLLKNANASSKVRIVQFFMLGYVTTLCAGYIFMIGRKLGVFSVTFIGLFNLMRTGGPERSSQRFTPGTDPNDYGILSSFFLSIFIAHFLIFFQQRTRKTLLQAFFSSPFIAAGLFPAAFLALIFTNTRSAIAAFAGGLGWIIFSTVWPRLRRPKIESKWVPYVILGCIFATSIAVVSPIAISNIDHLRFLVEKFTRAANGDGASEDRYVMWSEALERFASHPLFGSGYHTHEFIHNTYLQVLCDLGVIGTSLLIATGAIVFAQFSSRDSFSTPIPSRSRENVFLNLVSQLGLWHVMWFSATNHNIDQFLTWFTVFIILISRTKTRVTTEGELHLPQNRLSLA